MFLAIRSITWLILITVVLYIWNILLAALGLDMVEDVSGNSTFRDWCWATIPIASVAVFLALFAYRDAM